MKKIIATFVLSLFAITAFSQAATFNFQYYKVKPGHRKAFNDAIKSHTAKFRKAGTPQAWALYNVVGGSHHNEVMALYNLGISWAQRDELTGGTEEAMQDFYLNVSPHTEGVTAGEIITYRPEYSNASVSDRSAKIRTNMITLKYPVATEFWDVVKKLTKAWDKLGAKIATYSTSGKPRIIFTRRFPNGWKELDTEGKIKDAYDEIYGKGAHEKDMAIMRNHIIENEIMYMTMQPDLSSK